MSIMKNNYIVIGDSIVYGIGGYDQNGWASMLKNKLLNQEGTKESTNYVHCVGFPGATSKSILDKIESIVDVYYSEGMNNIFLLSIGINDTQIFNGKNKISIDEYKDNIIKIISVLREKDNCNIMVVGLTGIREKDEPFLWKPNKYYDSKTITNYNDILSEICDSNNIRYVSMMGVLNGNDFIDGLHPNDNGYHKIFSQILLAMEEK